MKLFFTLFLSVFLLQAYAQRHPQPLSGTVKLSLLSESYRAQRKSGAALLLELARQRGWTVRSILPGGGMLSLERVDALGLPVYTITTDNIRSAATTGTDQLWPGGASGLNLQGDSPGMSGRLGIWDGGGVLDTHREFGSRVTRKDDPLQLSDHSTHVAGTLVAAGLNRPARGMAFGAGLIAYDFLDDNAEMAEEAASLLVSNHSYGALAGWRYNDGQGRWEWYGEAGATNDYKFGYYDITSKRWDEIAYNAPYYLIVKSAGNNRNVNGPSEGSDYYRYNAEGEMRPAPDDAPFPSRNDGYDILPLYANAKNILVVGAVNPLPEGYTVPEEVVMTAFSSWGPTDDGRIKPDLVGNGIGVLSTSSESNDAYAVLSGTSMAAPNIAGSLFLLQELYSDLHEGNFMRSATLRGLAIHTAGESGDAPGPDYKFGWGVLNASAAAAAIVNPDGRHLIAEKTLAEEAVDSIELIASGAGPLEVTLSWTDPEADIIPEEEALDNRSPRLVNDLDLRLTHKSGGTVFFPWTLDPAHPEAPAATGDNVLDNVEKVIIPEPGPGQAYTVTISHKGTLSRAPQAYSVIVSGAGGQVYCNSAGEDAGPGVAGFRIGELDHTAPAGCSRYTDLLTEKISAEPGQEVPFTIQTRSCGAAGSYRARLFADWNADGDFEDAGEIAATSSVSEAGADFTGSLVIPSGTVPGTFTRLRLVVAAATDAVPLPCGSYPEGETLDLSLEVLPASVDLALEALAAPAPALCAGREQPVSVRIRNRGRLSQQRFPLSVSIRPEEGPVTRLEGVFEAALEAGEAAVYTFPERFMPLPSNSYTITIAVSQAGDRDPSNDTLEVSAQSPPAVNPPAELTALMCGTGNTAVLAGNGEGTLFWYDREASGRLLGAGDTVTASFEPGTTAFYAAVNDFSGQIGPASKSAFPPPADANAYNQYTPSVRIETRVPLRIESARLYTGNPGKIAFTVYNEKEIEVARRVLHVTASRSIAGPGQLPDDPSDTGKVYFLGLEIPEPGRYRIGISYEGSAATIFRNNNGVEGYPFSIPDVMSMTGNTSSDPAGYYYYFYGMKISSLGCPGPREAVQIAPLPLPVISQRGDTLFTAAAGQLQWFLDGTPLPGATENRLLGERSGVYRLSARLDSCELSSEPYRFTTLDDLLLSLEDRGLTLYPNPGPARAGSPLHIEFYAREQDEAELDILDMLGKTVYHTRPALISGKNILETTLDQLPPGMYAVRLRINNEVFGRKFLLHR